MFEHYEYFFGYYRYVFGVPEFLQRNAVPQPAARVTGTKQLYPKPSRVKLASQLVQHTHIHLHTNIYIYFSHLLSTKHSNINAHIVSSSPTRAYRQKHTQSVIHKYYLFNILQGHVQYIFSLTKTKQSSGTKSLGIELQPNKNPALTENYHTNQLNKGEYVRMIIMTDKKKETNQNQKA